MKAKEKEILKSHSLEELRAELAQSREKHFRLKFKNGVSTIPNVMELRRLKRHVARLMTWIRQKESVGAAAGPTASKSR